jgi:hypothetical protein
MTGLYLVFFNLFFVYLLFLTRNRYSEVKFTQFKTVLVGDIAGLSLVAYSLGTFFDPKLINEILIFVVACLAILIAFILHCLDKKVYKNSSGPGYSKGKMNWNGKVHFAYVLYNSSLLILLVYNFYIKLIIEPFFVAGVLIYLFSLFIDYKNDLFEEK